MLFKLLFVFSYFFFFPIEVYLGQKLNFVLQLALPAMISGDTAWSACLGLQTPSEMYNQILLKNTLLNTQCVCDMCVCEYSVVYFLEVFDALYR